MHRDVKPRNIIVTPADFAYIRGSVALAERDRIRICHHEFVFEFEARG